MPVAAPYLLLILPALVIVAAMKDATSFRIPNWISASAVVGFFPAALAAGASAGDLGVHLGLGVLGLIAGMIMFALRWVGGGDAKLLAACTLWLGWPAVVPFLICTALAGGALSLLLVQVRSNWGRALLPTGPAWVERLRQEGGDAPYGVAIAIGALAAFPQSTLVALAAS